jgi:hypothetical protein
MEKKYRVVTVTKNEFGETIYFPKNPKQKE